jgi:hypothetical protein
LRSLPLRVSRFLPHCLLAHIHHLSGTYSVHVLFSFHSCCEAPYNGWNEYFGKRQTGRYKNAQAIANRMLYMPPAKEEVRRGKTFVPRLQTSWIEVRVQASNVVEQ